MTHRRDWLGALVGILTFLVGIALLTYTFKVALELFSISPAESIGIKKGEPIDPAITVNLTVYLVQRTILLLFMCFIASLITNRGIRLYTSRRDAATVEASPKSEAA